jgi:acetyl-CoA acyltransferase
MTSAYLVDGVRTPIGNLKGALSDVRADDLAAHVMRELLKRNSTLDPSAIGDIIFGCANQAGEDNRNVARMASLLAGIPQSVPGETLNRLCASGLSSAMSAARMLMLKDADIMLAGGIEHMTRSPMVMSKSASAFGGDGQLFDSTFGWRFINPKMKEMYGTDAMGETAENLVARDNISRMDQDNFAYGSHMKAKKAQESGRLAQEIAPVTIPRRKGDPVVFENDEFIKPLTTLEGLAKLKAAFKKDGSVTAGNSSGLNDGACALLLANDEGVKKFNLKPRARIVSMGVAGVEPKIMGIGPVPATEIALKKAGLKLSEIDVIELNEAFAAQSLAVLRGLGIQDNDPRVNPNGGAIALGHPLGMSGARILNTAALELSLTKKRYALVTMCIGVGQGYAVIIERV